MALEQAGLPVDGPNHELADMTRRFWAGVVLAVPVLILDMGADLPLLSGIPPLLSVWIQFALATPVVLWAGVSFLRARLAIGQKPLAQYVQPDRARRRCRLCL